jgi:hypothetical protein
VRNEEECVCSAPSCFAISSLVELAGLVGSGRLPTKFMVGNDLLLHVGTLSERNSYEGLHHVDLLHCLPQLRPARSECLL